MARVAAHEKMDSSIAFNSEGGKQFQGGGGLKGKMTLRKPPLSPSLT